VAACRDIIRSGSPVTMPEVARAALVSEATAYRYFPDLPALISQAFPACGPARPRRWPRSRIPPIPSSGSPSRASSCSAACSPTRARSGP
jgi:hypothetical protein